MGNHLWTTLSSISTSRMFKHFIGGLVITVTIKISVFASFSSFLSQPRAALLQSPFARSGGSLQEQVDSRSLSPLGAGVSLHSGKGWRKGHCLSQQMGGCFRKGHNNRTKLLTCTSQNRPYSLILFHWLFKSCRKQFGFLLNSQLCLVQL